MTPDNCESQLELFDPAKPSTRPRHRETLGRFLVQMRYDQLVLAGIASLMTVTVIFAFGVERGKQLARGERSLLGREQQAQMSTPESMSGATVTIPISPAREKSSTPVLAPLTPKTKEPSKAKEPTKSVRSRYAVQVVTYRQAQLAKLELRRLKAKGEPAFLVIREGRTSLYIGPFDSKGHAQKQVVRLKSQYQDCFVKSL